jgi:hypothetical protein
MACDQPNLQNIPRSGPLRSYIRAPEGRIFVIVDYSQIELRVAAKISAYVEGRDLHTLTARSLTGIEEISKDDQKLARAVGLEPPEALGLPERAEHLQDQAPLAARLLGPTTQQSHRSDGSCKSPIFSKGLIRRVLPPVPERGRGPSLLPAVILGSRAQIPVEAPLDLTGIFLQSYLVAEQALLDRPSCKEPRL